MHIEDISRAFATVLEAPRETIHDEAFNVGRSEDAATALMVIATSQAVPTEVADALRASEGVLSVAVIDRA